MIMQFLSQIKKPAPDVPPTLAVGGTFGAEQPPPSCHSELCLRAPAQANSSNAKKKCWAILELSIRTVFSDNIENRAQEDLVVDSNMAPRPLSNGRGVDF